MTIDSAHLISQNISPPPSSSLSTSSSSSYSNSSFSSSSQNYPNLLNSAHSAQNQNSTLILNNSSSPIQSSEINSSDNENKKTQIQAPVNTTGILPLSSQASLLIEKKKGQKKNSKRLNKSNFIHLIKLNFFFLK